VLESNSPVDSAEEIDPQSGDSERLPISIDRMGPPDNNSSESSQSQATTPQEACEAFSQQAELRNRPIDIIWAIDTSPSMNAEKAAVRDNLNIFSQQIGAANIGVHVILLGRDSSDGGICVEAPLGSGACPNDDNRPTFHHNIEYVGSHNALSRMMNQYPEYKSSLRKDSIKYLAAVTDDSANTSAHDFTQWMQNNDPGWFDDWKFFGLFCANRDSGNHYQSLVDASGGLHVELCQARPDWQGVFDQMVDVVVSNRTLDCAWPIPQPPNGLAFAKDKVNVEYTPGGQGMVQAIPNVPTAADCANHNAWYYDDASNPQMVHACPAACDTIQADVEGRIDILFGCITDQILL
jgi:hypothetical protein